MDVQVYWSGKHELGEGPIWNTREQKLYWVDIFAKNIHCMDYATEKHQQWTMPSDVGCIGFKESGGLIAALIDGIYSLDTTTGQVSTLAELIVGRDDIRFNDGSVDPGGRFWAGTMDLTENEGKGALYRYDADGSVHLMTEGLVVSNGIGFSPDKKTLYHSDSGTGKISQYDFDLETGTISHHQLFVEIPTEAGVCDGMCVDSEGFLWVAHWNGWRITRFNPDGQIDKIIKMPVARPTSCCFGGPELNKLFISSARFELTAEELNQQPNAGNIFVIDVDIKGQAEPFFAS